jgi:hypothetical protein
MPELLQEDFSYDVSYVEFLEQPIG